MRRHLFVADVAVHLNTVGFSIKPEDCVDKELSELVAKYIEVYGEDAPAIASRMLHSWENGGESNAVRQCKVLRECFDGKNISSHMLGVAKNFDVLGFNVDRDCESFEKLVREFGDLYGYDDRRIARCILTSWHESGKARECVALTRKRS